MESELFGQLLNSADVKKINHVQFGLLSAEDIEKSAVCEIKLPETYEGSNPKIEGLMDPRMGTTDPASINPTDGLRTDISPQYFGMIRLAAPVFYYQYMGMTQKILKCVCHRCSNLLVSKTDPIVLQDLGKKTKDARFNVIHNYAKTIKKCIHNDYCNAHQPSKYVLLTADKLVDKKNIVNAIQLVADITDPETKDNNRVNMEPEQVLKIFKNISDDDLRFMGFTPEYFRPENMICQVLPVPPPAVRPSVRQDNNQRAEDDLTHFLMNIVKFNNDLRSEISKNSSKEKIDQYKGALQHVIITYIDNNISKVPKFQHRSSSRPMKSIKQRWIGKEGRLRGNIMGKRVDRSARSVISVDPNISIDELGVPLKIAMNLAIDEEVNKYNIVRLTNMVRNGPNKYPGAKNVIKMRSEYKGQPPISIWDLGYGDNAINIPLEPGDIVQRHLVNGDAVIFNRQPSLHRMSIMCHKVRVFPSDTFRLNVFACAPYNADFDGDEMNMHVANSLMTQSEISELMVVSKQVITPTRSKPILTIVQDTLIGAYLLTNPETTITRQELYNIIMFDKKFNGIIPPPDLTNPDRWYGRTVYSLILPDITYTDNKSVNIENGKISLLPGKTDDYGRLSSKNLGSSGIIQAIYNIYGPNGTKSFMDNTQNLITKWMITNSFSIGFGDIIIPKDVINENKKIIDNAIDDTNQLIKKTQLGKYHPNISNTLRNDQFEAEMMKILKDSAEKVKTNIIKVVSTNNNSMYESIESGTKGKPFNLVQIMGLVGQQTVYNIRMKNTYDKRALPHFPKDDYGATSRGFCKNSFAEGLTPVEFYYHAIDGRTGSIDTAVGTAEVGYISRRLIKAMEDIKIEYDQTVRNSNNKIVQFSYGNDNFDPIKLEQIPINLIEYSNSKMQERYEWLHSTEWNKYLSVNFKPTVEDKQKLNEELTTIYKLRDIIRQNNRIDVISALRVYTPFNPSRLIYVANKKFGAGNSKTDLTPIEIIDRVNELMTKLRKLFKQKNILLEALFYTHMTSKQLILQKVNSHSLDYLLNMIYMKTLGAIVQPGEMVGIVSAQSMGEPSTQLTLNTFHSVGSGGGAVVVTEGVPRFKEILDKTKDIKTASMNIFLKKPLNKLREEAKKVASNIVYTKLENIISNTSITYGTPNTEQQTESQNFLEASNVFAEILGVKQPDNLSKWSLLLEFDQESMLTRKIYMMDIQKAIMEFNPNIDDKIRITYSDDNSKNIYVRFNIIEVDDPINVLRQLNRELLNLKLRGISGIIKASEMERNTVNYSEHGDYFQDDEWVINTQGSNLYDIMNLDYVNTEMTTTNDIIEIMHIFGIEAARALIIEESNKVFSGDVALRHIQLLADTMTSKGYIMSVNRHGINKSIDKEPLSKASFEEVADIIMEAAIFSKVNKMNGTASNIVMGQLVKGGTNSCEVLIDEQEFMQLNDNGTEYQQEYIDEAEIEELIDGELKYSNVRDDDFNFGFDLEEEQNKPLIDLTITAN